MKKSTPSGTRRAMMRRVSAANASRTCGSSRSAIPPPTVGRTDPYCQAESWLVHRDELDRARLGAREVGKGVVRALHCAKPGEMAATGALLADVRIIESSLLGPGGVGMQLADLGAEVIKVEN